MAQAEAAAPAPAPSSRLCVKNIPKYVDEKRLREFFSTKGDVTDVKILRTKCEPLGRVQPPVSVRTAPSHEMRAVPAVSRPRVCQGAARCGSAASSPTWRLQLPCRDGASRCFGFVGLKTAAQAEGAAKYFHKAFMDTCRLEIEFAESFMDRATTNNTAKRPWSKHSAGSSAHAAAVGGGAQQRSSGWQDAPAAGGDAAKNKSGKGGKGARGAQVRAC